MAGFCRNCGSPLADSQGFCTKCGTPVAGPPARPAAPASPAPPSNAPAATPPRPAPTPPAPRPQSGYQPVAAVAPPKKGMSTFAKVMLALLAVVLVLGACAVAGVFYLIHKGKEKIHEMGLDEVSTANQGPVLGGADPCGLLSKDDVGQVVKLEVVRAERTRGAEAGCQYSVMGNYPDMVANHLTQMQKDMADKQQLTPAQKQQMDEMAKSMFRSANAQQGSPSEHPGESPVFLFSVGNSGVKAQMSVTRMIFSRMGPAFTDLPGVGDEAFDIGGSMILARKGDKIIRVMYMMCPCGRDDAVSLVKKVADGL